MGDAMPPLLEALPIRTEPCKSEQPCTQASILEEGELDERRMLLGYSTSPPPLIEDRSGLLEDDSPASLKQADLQTLRDELELSAFEYAALGDRYSVLSRQHRELQELASAYEDVIRGSSGCDEGMPSLEQLQVEAGREGLRAKALETDMLRPLIREAGGAQAFVTRAQALQSLADANGGLQELTEQVRDAASLTRQGLRKLGGVQGLTRLVTEVDNLRSEQREHAALRASVEGPDGLRSRALKYDMLQQAFAAVQRGPANGPPQTNRTLLQSAPVQKVATGAPAQGSTSSYANGPVINPARAQLLSAAPDRRDPDRDLYEPPPPPPPPATKTGSNHIPLGSKRRRGGGASIDQDFGRGDSKRLKYGDEPQASPAPIRIRRKIDVDRASAMVHANIQNNAITTRNDTTIGRPAWVGGGGSVATDGRPAGSWQVRFDTLLGSSITSSPAGIAPLDGRLSREMSSRSPRPEHLPTIKK